MLFPYQYIAHRMEKMQEFIDYIFFEVWCKALNGDSYSFNLFDGNKDLKAIMHAMYYAKKPSTSAVDFQLQIERIYNLFARLTASEIVQFTTWYEGNNSNEKACANENTVSIIRYEDISKSNPDIAAALYDFFYNLYPKYIKIKQLKQLIGTVDDHYAQFVTHNITGICPSCGLTVMKGKLHSTREAYDHYLPKHLYPFNSINFHNLAPTCHECNSSYKLRKDPLHKAGQRRRAFYPYSTKSHSLTVEVNIKRHYPPSMRPFSIPFRPSTITVSIVSPRAEEVATWKELYNIDERYIAACCANGEGKYWITQCYDEWKTEGNEPSSYLNTIKRRTKKTPFAEKNFLKLAFLEGCQRAGFLGF